MSKIEAVIAERGRTLAGMHGRRTKQAGCASEDTLHGDATPDAQSSHRVGAYSDHGWVTSIPQREHAPRVEVTRPMI